MSEIPEPYLIPLSADGRQVIAFPPQSTWAAVFADYIPDDCRVFVRIGAQHNRSCCHQAEMQSLAIQDIRATAAPGRRVGSSLLREIPYQRIEAAINQRTHRAVLLDEARQAVEPLTWPDRPAPVACPMPDLAVEDPGGYRKPDDFYQHLGELFLSLAAISSRPAQEIAEANDVKPTTVHGWIREAKARGLLLVPETRGDQ